MGLQMRISLSFYIRLEPTNFIINQTLILLGLAGDLEGAFKEDGRILVKKEVVRLPYNWKRSIGQGLLLEVWPIRFNYSNFFHLLPNFITYLFDSEVLLQPILAIV